ncbi:hypothetical protein [Streptomyces abikoensis]|uniref:Uncharacterized protein n=1 Tax=Streptomyces abikoensis TaxID=97398 RepID=A0ABW7T8R9_9ACTN
MVLCRQPLAETAYRFLDLYEQPVGPAVVIPPLMTAAVFVPAGTEDRWPALLASQWPDDVPRPSCLGRQHAIQVPPPAFSPSSPARWLIPPEIEIGFPPHLTSPVPLARCLSEAREALRERPELHRRRTRRAAKRVRP